MTTRESLHALVDQLEEGDLSRARAALEELLMVEVSEAELAELLERDAACERGEGIDAREFLAKLRGASADSKD